MRVQSDPSAARVRLRRRRCFHDRCYRALALLLSDDDDDDDDRARQSYSRKNVAQTLAQQ